MRSLSFKSSIDFPPPHRTDPDGLIAVGGRLDVATLYHAYSMGIFPWPQEGLPILWFSPPQRGVLYWDRLHISESLKKFRRKNQGLQWTWNQCFEKVMEACAEAPRAGQEGTWILPEMMDAYGEFHRSGYAHSLEIWENGDLVAGIYGVLVKGVFSAESMFQRKSNASKLALWILIEELQRKEFFFLDIQMVTNITESFGGILIPRREFQQRLLLAQRDPKKSLF